MFWQYYGLAVVSCCQISCWDLMTSTVVLRGGAGNRSVVTRAPRSQMDSCLSCEIGFGFALVIMFSSHDSRLVCEPGTSLTLTYLLLFFLCLHVQPPWGPHHKWSRWWYPALWSSRIMSQNKSLCKLSHLGYSVTPLESRPWQAGSMLQSHRQHPPTPVFLT